MNNLEKEFIPYKQALALKELGFNEPCLSYYEGESFSYHLATTKDSDGYIIPAPQYQQAFRWFREKYNLQQYIYPTVLKNDGNNTYFSDYCWNIFGTNIPFKKTNDLDVNNISYEEAELQCLIKLIEIVKKE